MLKQHSSLQHQRPPRSLVTHSPGSLPLSQAALPAASRALVESWIDYVAGEHFSGGCFFWAASAEFDGRPGLVREQIAQLTGQWLNALRDEAKLAQRLGEIRSDIEPAQLAFELHAYTQEANWAYQLLGAPESFDRARRAVEDRLRGLATPEGLRVGKVRRVAKVTDANLVESA